MLWSSWRVFSVLFFSLPVIVSRRSEALSICWANLLRQDSYFLDQETALIPTVLAPIFPTCRYSDLYTAQSFSY